MAISRNARSSRFSFIFSKAYANHDVCNSQINKINIDDSVPAKSASGLIGGCLDSLSSGFEEGSIGNVKSTWQTMSSEFNKFINKPSERMNDYWNFVSKNLQTVYNFMEALGQAFIDPSEGIVILKTKFGETGELFGQIYQNVSNLSFQSKLDLICNIIGNLGFDFILTTVTIGAGTGKLSLTLGKVLDKIVKISKLLGKGLSLPFKILNELEDHLFNGIESIIKSGNKDIFNDKLKALDCAI
jgi:hypothetical protein